MMARTSYTRSTKGKSITRRAAIGGIGSGIIGAVLPIRLLRAADAFRFSQDPFTLGVASGYPLSDSVVLWTRLAPSPLEPGGGIAANAAIAVSWELATDDKMQNVVRRGVEYATPQWAHSVHAEPGGLEPETYYWYRFTAGDMRSLIGRTRTAPRPEAPNARLRIAVASCQQYEQGYYVAYRHMLDSSADLVLHLGDYIYESSWGNNRIRNHNAPDAITLDDYRARYALYRGERELQAAHAACPWLVTWDDHEVENDYAGAVSQGDDARDWFLARRAAAYQAFYEHMPLPRHAVPFGADMHLFAQRTFGQLVNICMLDTRQYRSPLPCTEPGRRGSRLTDCKELHDPARSKLGTMQENWLKVRMAASRARWNLFASGTVMAYSDEKPGNGQAFWTDSWNGYPAARARLMDALAETRVANPIILSGDIHSYLTANLHRVPHDPDSPVVAAEVTTTSITSQGVNQASLDDRRASNPHILFANSERRGYVLLDITRARVGAELIAMDSVTQRDAGKFVQATFVTHAGQPGFAAEGASIYGQDSSA